MTPLIRNCHRLAVAVHLCGVVVFAYAYADSGHWSWALLLGWAAFYGAKSMAALRQFGRDRGGE